MGTLGAPTTWLPDVAKYFTNLKGIIKISLEISDKKKRHNKNKSERDFTLELLLHQASGINQVRTTAGSYS